ncbi:disulfide bond formation protein B [Azospirillum sp. sgz301742]
MPHRLTLIDPRLPALLLALAAAGVLGAAFVFQYGFGYQPCVLCIWQRWPYAAVLAFSITTLAFPRWRGVGDAMLVASGFALLANVGIASYHVGVEQHWWASGCSVTGAAMTLEEMRAQIMSAPVVRCDDIQWSLFGITMAGYNVAVSLVLSVFAFASARTAYLHADRSNGIPA